MKTALALLLLIVPAFAAGDAAALGRLYHNDLAYTHSNAMTQTKAAAIAAETKPDGIYKAHRPLSAAPGD